MSRGKNSPVFKVSDFIPHHQGNEKVKQSVDEMKGILSGMASIKRKRK